jgi:hypothetical protein
MLSPLVVFAAKRIRDEPLAWRRMRLRAGEQRAMGWAADHLEPEEQ